MSTNGRDERGRFAPGNPGGPGRPPGRGVESFIKALREKVSDNAEEFAERVYELAMKGDSTALRVVVERAYPQKVELEHATQGPVEISWRREPDVPEDIAAQLRPIAEEYARQKRAPSS